MHDSKTPGTTENKWKLYCLNRRYEAGYLLYLPTDKENADFEGL
jgi:hypothetical protein